MSNTLMRCRFGNSDSEHRLLPRTIGDYDMRGFKVAIGMGALLAIAVSSRGLEASAQATSQDTEIAAFKELYRRPGPVPVQNPALAELGAELFWDTRISASGKTACGSCHFPHLSWATTEARSINDSGRPTSRKSPTVLGLGHIEPGTPLGWDGRNPSLEAQAKSSIMTGSMSLREAGTPVPVEVIEERIRSNSEYREKFNRALPGKPITIDAIASALATFERTLEPGIAPFDRWIEGDESAISEAAKRGFVTFNTKGACVACHNGWRFTNDSFHDIGTTTTDLGRGREVKDDIAMQYAFKTPSLRSVAVRAPYMHNGSAKTLDDVVKLYQKGGIDRPSRSPAIFPLELTEQDRADLVAFMETLTGASDGPARWSAAAQ